MSTVDVLQSTVTTSTLRSPLAPLNVAAIYAHREVSLLVTAVAVVRTTRTGAPDHTTIRLQTVDPRQPRRVQGSWAWDLAVDERRSIRWDGTDPEVLAHIQQYAPEAPLLDSKETV